jgi:hypothetical protein
MIRFITLFIGAFLAVMIAIQEIAPYFITDIDFPRNALIITLGISIASLIVVIFPRLSMVLFAFIAAFAAFVDQTNPQESLSIYAAASLILMVMSYMSFISLRRENKRIKEDVNKIDPYDL